ncbi:DUF4127 family protein [Daejeonella lutea]|nr:DUF4127 family protein [Daejeonella lutea]
MISFKSMAQETGTKILLIPLDDRPPCLQFTQKLGMIADCEVVSPPKEMLGKFTKPGEPDRIIDWIRKQDLKSFKAAIISLDMIAYGGLVASRVNETSLAVAENRLKILHEIKRKSPGLPIYGQSVIMRLAPTSDGKNEPYREKLARWADISPYPINKLETEKLENDIPADALKNYKQARRRNLTLNQAAVELIKTGILEYLILSQDDAKPKGVHVADRELLSSSVAKSKLGDKIIIQPGTDEISMLLLSRALNKLNATSPKVFVKYSSESAANSAMPFEDRPLRNTVTYNIVAAGATETLNPTQADLIFYVFASRADESRAESFALEINRDITDKKHVMIADIDPKGNIQGGDPTFANALIKMKVFTEVYSYASWNTAGNTVGTALPQGLIFNLAEKKMFENQAQKMLTWKAQNWFTMHRLLDDYLFHTIVRPKANEYFKQSNRSGFERTEKVAREVETYARELLEPMFITLSDIYLKKRPGSIQEDIECRPANLKFSLPWNRTFEGEIEFDMVCH